MQIKQVGPRSAAELNKMNKLVADGMTPAEAAKTVDDMSERCANCGHASGAHTSRGTGGRPCSLCDCKNFIPPTTGDASAPLQWLKQNNPSGTTRQIAESLAKKFDLSDIEAVDIVNEWKMTGGRNTKD